jgi:hypothetical protein
VRREREGEVETLQGSSSPERRSRRTRRRVLVLAALAAILVGIVVGWLAYAVLAGDPAPLSGALEAWAPPSEERILPRNRP